MTMRLKSYILTLCCILSSACHAVEMYNANMQNPMKVKAVCGTYQAVIVLEDNATD